jgi:hypothetical protein
MLEASSPQLRPNGFGFLSRVRNSTIPAIRDEVNAAIASLFALRDEQQRESANQWLIAWRRSVSSLPIALEIVREGFNPRSLSLAAQAIHDIVESSCDDLTDTEIDQVMETVTVRARSQINPRTSLSSLSSCVTQ